MALARPPRNHEKELPPRLFSHQCLEGKFCEHRHDGVLRTTHSPDPIRQALRRAYRGPWGVGRSSATECRDGCTVGLWPTKKIPAAGGAPVGGFGRDGSGKWPTERPAAFSTAFERPPP